MARAADSGGGFVSALRFPALNSVYDPLIAVTTRERSFRRRLLDRADLRTGTRALDVGSGSGTLLLMAAERAPGAELHGVEPDPDMRARAERKAAERGARVEFREAMADALPYEDGSFDSVLSSLVFHHLGRDGIRAAAAEIVRVLKPGGEFHLADWSRPSDPVMSALSWQVRLLDGVETTRESFSGRVPDLLLGAGLSAAGGSERLRTAFGVLEVSSHAKRSGFKES